MTFSYVRPARPQARPLRAAPGGAWATRGGKTTAPPISSVEPRRCVRACSRGSMELTEGAAGLGPASGGAAEGSAAAVH